MCQGRSCCGCFNYARCSSGISSVCDPTRHSEEERRRESDRYRQERRQDDPGGDFIRWYADYKRRNGDTSDYVPIR